MKTHELAKALETLAFFLRNQKNQDLQHFVSDQDDRLLFDDVNIKVGLSHLVALSRVDKQQWLYIINDLNYPIDVRPRDASRDILGKLLRHLEKNEEARQKLMDSTKGGRQQSSPELLRALDSLLHG